MTTESDTGHRALPYQKVDAPGLADGHARREIEGCGDVIEFFVRITDDTVSEVTCRVSGCANVVAAARVAGTIAKGRSLKDAMRETTPENIDRLAGLDEGERHCADTASEAMKAALTDAAVNAREPWRRLYRKH